MCVRMLLCKWWRQSIWHFTLWSFYSFDASALCILSQLKLDRPFPVKKILLLTMLPNYIFDLDWNGRAEHGEISIRNIWLSPYHQELKQNHIRPFCSLCTYKSHSALQENRWNGLTQNTTKTMHKDYMFLLCNQRMLHKGEHSMGSSNYKLISRVTKELVRLGVIMVINNDFICLSECSSILFNFSEQKCVCACFLI